MTRIEKHIEKLLLDNDCVIIPSFGGFMAHHIAARYDKEDGVFLPPQRSLGFNSQLTMNDSLLVQSYIEAYDISYPEALHSIEEEVEEIRQHIENNGSYNFHNIGIISRNNQGNDEFTPCEAGILTPNLYGMGLLEILPVSHNTHADYKKAAAKYDKHAVATEESVFDSNSESTNKTIKVRMSVIQNIAVAAIALLVFLLTPARLDNGDMPLVNQGSIDTSMLKRLIVHENIADGAVNTEKKEVKSVDKEEESAPVISAKAAEEKAEASFSPYYSLVLASHVTKKNAADYIERLHKKGYTQAQMFIRNSVKVVFGHYRSEQEAYNELAKLSKNEDFKEAWVLHIKK